VEGLLVDGTSRRSQKAMEDAKEIYVCMYVPAVGLALGRTRITRNLNMRMIVSIGNSSLPEGVEVGLDDGTDISTANKLFSNVKIIYYS